MSDVKLVKLNAAVETAAAKLVSATESRDKYVADTAAREAALNIPEGTEGTFVFGRAETAKTLTGKVIAVVETGSGNLLKVLAGEGKDLRVYDVASSKFTPASAVTLDPIVDSAEVEVVAEVVPEVSDLSAADAAVLALV
jgi:hypothetical protein